ncbi:MAG: phosphoribosylformylglycinamidine synthase subunit PurS, partial [Ktedonobacteraceae bacterium]|nr:phosphoribosylformylglycinamidine synthase subunit PurS [Ktedonobacteraceae bacterium]
MTFFQIEVRAIYEQHDAHAHKLAREILQLSAQQIPFLTEISAASSPLSIRTAQLYHLSGDLSSSQIEQLTRQLLVDPVVQEASSGRIPDDAATGHIVDVFFHHGVTDTLAESVIAGARMLSIMELERVETGRRYVLDRRLSASEAHTIARALLYNPVIQHYTLYKADSADKLEETSTESFANGQTGQARIISTLPLSTMTDEQLMEVSRTGLLALNLDEMRAIQRHYQQQGREPTDVELETLAQTWSEHCSHKTFKAIIAYRETDSSGNIQTSESIPGLLKHYIMRATEQVRPSWLVSAFSDNAGIIRYTEQHDLAFKVETHNHPSAIEPFGGANTGVGGVIRAVLGVSARPIACTDVLCFGPLETPADELPDGVLSPRRIASGVVNGVRDYGNKMGIPTVNGAVLYHSGYIYNPLVFCGCLGILPHGSHPDTAQPGDFIVVLGGRTGRDGVHGATFSSGEMSSEINAQAGAAVQIGAPITEKKVADVIVQARERKLYHAITDCGAGGFSSAIGEMGARTGASVELTHAPLKYQGLTPWEIWLSEAQERMVLAVPSQHLEELLELCTLEEVEASIAGTFTADHRLVVKYSGQVVADMDMQFLHSGCPRRTLEAVWTPKQQVANPDAANQHLRNISRSLSPTLLSLLRHPALASKEDVVRRYDYEVQGATVLKPLVGKAGNGPGDAAVLQPILDEQTQAAIVLSN